MVTVQREGPLGTVGIFLEVAFAVILLSARNKTWATTNSHVS